MASYSNHSKSLRSSSNTTMLLAVSVHFGKSKVVKMCERCQHSTTTYKAMPAKKKERKIVVRQSPSKQLTPKLQVHDGHTTDKAASP